MIVSDEAGQNMMDDLSKHKDDIQWNEWEEKFLYDMNSRDFCTLSPKQKSMVETLFDKLMGR